MYKLYYSPGACSMSIHIILNECNQPVTLVKVDLQNKPPELLKANPRGQVPALEEDGKVIREGAAIIIHLLEKHQSPLLPKSDPARLLALEWLMFCNASLHPAYSRVFFLKRNAPEAAKAELFEKAMAMLDKYWAEIEQRLSASPYLCGPDITAADILLTVIANWQKNLPRPVAFGPNTKRLLQTVSSRPAYQKALQAEQVEYQVAA